MNQKVASRSLCEKCGKKLGAKVACEIVQSDDGTKHLQLCASCGRAIWRASAMQKAKITAAPQI